MSSPASPNPAPLPPPRIPALVVALALLVVGGLAFVLSAPPPPAAARITNPPDSPIASIRRCIQSGESLGRPSHFSPRFVAACMAGAFDRPSYDFDNAIPDNAGRTFAILTEFGASSNGRTGHRTLATAGDGGLSGAVNDGGTGLGTVFGLAYSTGSHPDTHPALQGEQIFAASYVKRVTRFGMGGPGAIYVIDRTTREARLYAQVPGVVPGPAGAQAGPAGFANLPGDGSAGVFPNSAFHAYTPEMGGLHTFGRDDTTAPHVGRAGLGGLAVSSDERWLATVNLRSRNVVFFDTHSAGSNPTPEEFIINPGVAGCPGGNGDFRPFALTYHPDDEGNDFAYLGYVCSGETHAHENRRDHLYAGVLRWQAGVGTVSRVLHFRLDAFDAQRATGAWRDGNEDQLSTQWMPWRDATLFHPGTTSTIQQPMLTSIAFTEAGDMLLGLRSRATDIGTTERFPDIYTRGQGDMLVARSTGSGGWTAPDSGSHDHFRDETGYLFSSPRSNPVYPEGLGGGVTTVPGMHDGSYGGEVVSTAARPRDNEHWSGALWFDVETGGEPTAAEEFYNGANHFKSSGLGDVELLCGWRAIGSRVWHDENGNGIQDPGEPDIHGVVLELLDANGIPRASVTTGPVNPDEPEGDNWRFYVAPHEEYSVRIRPDMFAPGGILEGFAPTRQHAGGDPRLDSDADANGVVAIGVGLRSQVDLRYAFGLVEGEPEPWVEKTGPPTVNAGQELVYTIRYGNRGHRAADGVTIVDTLPTGFTYLSATGNHTVVGQTITWNLGTLEGGAGEGTAANPALQVTLRVRATGTETDFPLDTTTPGLDRVAEWQRTNTAIISSTTPDVDPDSSSTTTTIRRPNLTISKSGPATAEAGEHFDYTITVRNNGVLNAAGVVVEDTLPAGLTYVSSPQVHTRDAQRVRWNVGTLNAGTSRTFTLRVRAAATFDPATRTSWSRTNAVLVTTTTPGAGEKWATTSTLLQRPNLTIQITSPSPVNAGAEFDYTITIGNDGSIAAREVSLVHDLPTVISYLSATGTHTRSGQRITWANLGTLAVNGSRTFTVRVRATENLNHFPITMEPNRRTSISAVSWATVDATNAASAMDSVTTTIQRPEVSIRLTGPTPILVGDEAVYTITYENAGTAPAHGVQVTYTMPDGYDVVSSSGGGTRTQSGQTLTWASVGTVAAGASGSIEVRVRPTVNAAETATHEARISTTSVADSPHNNLATLVVRVQFPDVWAELTLPTASAELPVGEWHPVRVNFGNYGDGLARTSLFTVTLPMEVNQTRNLPAGCALLASNQVRCNVGDLAPGASGSRSFEFRLPPDYPPDDVTIAVRIDTATPERPSDMGNNDDERICRAMRPNVYIQVRGENQSVPMEPGWRSYVRFRVTYGNDVSSATLPVGQRRPANRTWPAQNVEISVPIPANAQVHTVVHPPSVTYVIDGNTLRFTLGTLAARASGSIAITLEINEQPGGSVGMAASIATSSPGDEPVDNQSSDSMTILPPPADVPEGSGDLRLAIHSTLDPAHRGGSSRDAVYRSDDTNITWPAGEVLDFTPRLVTLNIPNPTWGDPTTPYGVQGRVTGWSIVNFGLPTGTVGAHGADARGIAGCRAGSTALAGTRLNGCTYAYPGATNQWSPLNSVIPGHTVSEGEMEGQGHVYWTHRPVAGAQLPSMRNDVYLFALPELRPVQLTVAVEVEVRVMNLYPGAPLGDWSYAPVELTTIPRQRHVYEGTFVITLLTPRSVVGPGS
ncbi:SdrD B-like domain-containing protein [Candidatus Viridilinea mediisalina]|uniref:DUF11 domain-containing protein n=1 Tax=Candidatus Viridilinea mediisalina TaxID=2024553 RepID=A0A2A6RI74_9CHLR|nr:SdrD B-like domain-containing protein [Candidatus Viridilinea mediisalina]PDW02596.1 hypothetical protein CJ255_13175 [Candidatus Viridilinea mediisalina]